MFDKSEQEITNITGRHEMTKYSIGHKTFPQLQYLTKKWIGNFEKMKIYTSDALILLCSFILTAGMVRAQCKYF